MEVARMFKNFLFLITACLMVCGIADMMVSDSSAQENIYDIDIQPLTLADCGRCHATHFSWLKNNGAKHQGVACTECHEQFHLYNPIKNNYAAIMPKCSQCHDNPHGTAPQVTACLNCHTNPHQPIVSLPVPSKLEDNCRTCHAPIAQLLTQNPSKHTERQCSECHSTVHGRIPDCSECHDNHSPMVTLQTTDCLSCHPVHTPLAISYPETQANELCAGCHEKVYATLKASSAKHSQLTCAKCHPTHGEIPQCRRCHGSSPHSASMLEKFPDCLTCHFSPHDLHI